MNEIMINEMHLGPFAQPEHAKELVTRLRSQNWPVRYVSDSTSLIWRFDNSESFNAFSVAFESIVDEMTGGRAGYWIVEQGQAHLPMGEWWPDWEVG